MAKIPEYDSNIVPNSTINTHQASGVSAGAGLEKLGQGISTLGQGIEEFQARNEIAKTYKGVSNIHVGADNDVKNLSKPMDENGVTDYVAKLDENYAKVREQIGTGKALESFDKLVATDRKSIIDNLNTRNVHLMREQRVEQYAGTQKDYSRIIFDKPDQLTFDQSVQHMSDFATSLTGVDDSLKQKLVRESGKEFSFSNFNGVLQTYGGSEAKKVLSDGRYDNYVDGTEKAQMAKAADSYDKAKLGELAQARRDAREARQDKDEKMSNAFLKLNAEKKLSIDTILNSDVSAHVKKEFMKMLSDQKEGVFVDQSPPQAKLFDRIRLPDNDPNKIFDQMQLLQEAQKMGLRDQKSLNFLSDSLEQDKSAQGKAEYQGKQKAYDYLKNTMMQKQRFGIDDKIGSKRYNQAVADLNDVFAAGVKQGKDPLDMLNPTSKDYIVSKVANMHAKTPEELIAEQVQESRIARVKRGEEIQAIENRPQYMSASEMLKVEKDNKTVSTSPSSVSTTTSAQSRPEARKPGESAAEYLKRTGSK